MYSTNKLACLCACRTFAFTGWQNHKPDLSKQLLVYLVQPITGRWPWHPSKGASVQGGEAVELAPAAPLTSRCG
jgi:hypothetical protein